MPFHKSLEAIIEWFVECGILWAKVFIVISLMDVFYPVESVDATIGRISMVAFCCFVTGLILMPWQAAFQWAYNRKFKQRGKERDSD